MDNSIPIQLTTDTVRKVDFKVLVDILNDGTFSYDLSSDLMSIDNIIMDLETKKTGSVLGKPLSDKATITIDNSTGYYSPNNSEHNIEHDYPTGKFRVNTKIKILIGFIDTDNISNMREMFTGVITKFNDKYALGDTKVVLELTDFSKFAKLKKNPNHDYNNEKYYESIMFNASISDALNYLIDYCYGSNFSRNIQEISAKLPVIEFPVDQNIWATIQKLVEASNGKAYFTSATFVFVSPLSLDYNESVTSQFTFTTDHIFDFNESIDESNIINKFKITSNAKTMQPRTVICGTPNQNIITMIDVYRNSDTKNALDSDNKTIILKSQQNDLSWINSFNVPLISTTTYSDLIQSITLPSQIDIDNLNNNSTIKVWDKINNIQLTINSLDLKLGKIVLLNELDPNNYSVQVQYQYDNSQIVHGNYRWYELKFDKSAQNIELPIIEANDSINIVPFSNSTPTNNLYFSDWSLFDGNTRCKFKLTNNIPIVNSLDVIHITKMEIWGNVLECANIQTFEAVDGSTINDFQNAYEVTNDYIIDPDFGQQLVDNLLHKYKNNLVFIDANTKGIPQIDLLDRITIIETSKSGINFDFNVIGIKHTYSLNNGLKTSLNLESVISPWTYDPTRTTSYSSYDKRKESYIVSNAYVIPSPPTNLILTESSYLQSSGELVTKLNINFKPAAYTYYSHSLIQSSVNNKNWIDVGSSINGNYDLFGLVTNTTYYIRVKTISINNAPSTYTNASIVINGKDNLPSDVSSLIIKQVGNNLTAIIVPCIDPDIKRYELRMGTSWENSYFIANFTGNSITWQMSQQGTQTFWVKAVDNADQYSTNPAKTMINIINFAPQNQPNVIFSRVEDLTTWATTNMYLDVSGKWQIDSVQQIGTTGYFADMFSQGTTLLTNAQAILPNIDLGTDIINEDLYYIDIWGNIKFYTTKKLGDFTNFSDIFKYPYVYVSIVTKISTFFEETISYNANSNTFINIQYRTSFNNINWNDWVDLINNQFIARYIQIRLLPISINNKTNVSIDSMTNYVTALTVNQLIENISITDTSEATHISYPQLFYTEPTSLVLWTKDTTGKMCVWRTTNITNEGFDLDLLDDSNNRITGTLIKCDAKGY